MGKPAVSLRHKLIALCATGLLACGLAPAVSLADESVAGGSTSPEYENDARSASPDSDLSSAAEGAILASLLAPNGASIVSADVALDAAEPVVGSFTVDGLTYALNDGKAALVSVAGPLAGPEEQGSAEGGSANIAIPASVAYDGATYDVTAIGSYAFYLSGATSVDLPDSIMSVDDRAFRSSDVGAVSVDPANPNLASFDSALYSADESRLLLIPEGRKGSVLLSCETEVVQASVFSHCSLVEAISVEEGGAAFSSWEGCLYDASGETLLRVPAGATDITIHDGCTSIAAGAMEGCAKLERINAPATVASISPDVFESVSTISLPAAALIEDAPQLTAMVALSSANDGLSTINPAAVAIVLPYSADSASWRAVGFQPDEGTMVDSGIAIVSEDAVLEDSALPTAALQDASLYAAGMASFTINSPEESLRWEDWTSSNPPGILSGSGVLTTSWTTSYFDICSRSSTANAVSRSGDELTLQMTSGGWGGRCITLKNNDPGYELTWTRNGGTVSATSQPADYHLSGNVGITVSQAPRTFEVTLNKNGGSGGTDAIYVKYATGWYSDAEASAGITSITAPKLAGYTFKGYNWNGQAGVMRIRADGSIATGATSFTDNVTWDAVWEANVSKVTLNKNGGAGGPDAIYLRFDDGYYSTSACAEADKIASVETPKLAGYTFKGYNWNGQAGVMRIRADGSIATGATSFTDNVTWDAVWEANVYEVTFDGNGGKINGATSWTPPENPITYASSNQRVVSQAVRTGYTFMGYYTAENGGVQVYEPRADGRVEGVSGDYWKNGGWCYADNTQPITLYAQWIPVVSADVPIEVTARVDLLGIEEQVEASGYIESRSGGSLEVAEVAFDSLEGAAALFGSRTADVFLEALAEGSTAADLRFALDAAATEVDPSKLAAFVLPDGYGTRKHVTYRFDIPDEVLASIDQSSFEQVTTPVGQIVYTVVLAG